MPRRNSQAAASGSSRARGAPGRRGSSRSSRTSGPRRVHRARDRTGPPAVGNGSAVVMVNWAPRSRSTAPAPRGGSVRGSVPPARARTARRGAASRSAAACKAACLGRPGAALILSPQAREYRARPPKRGLQVRGSVPACAGADGTKRRCVSQRRGLQGSLLGAARRRR